MFSGHGLVRPHVERHDMSGFPNVPSFKHQSCSVTWTVTMEADHFGLVRILSLHFPLGLYLTMTHRQHCTIIMFQPVHGAHVHVSLLRMYVSGATASAASMCR